MAIRKSMNVALVETLSGLTEEIRALRLTGERAQVESHERRKIDLKMISEFNERRLADYRLLEAIHGMTTELAALRMQRAQGGNGHAKEDLLEADEPDSED